MSILLYVVDFAIIKYDFARRASILGSFSGIAVGRQDGSIPARHIAYITKYAISKRRCFLRIILPVAFLIIWVFPGI